MADYSFEEEEWKKIQKWIKTHKDKNGKRCFLKEAGAVGGAFSYHFTPTGIGVIVVAHCGHCKQELDITDYSSW